MATIFISYRRDDTAGTAMLIFERLQALFGQDAVFIDVYGIPGGANFHDHITAVLSTCRVVLAVIGPKWVGEALGGGRRIDDPKDTVRIELETALGQKLPVISVLVDRARLSVEDLPPSLFELVDCNWARVELGRGFDHQVNNLIKDINYHLSGSVPRPTAAVAVPRTPTPHARGSEDGPQPPGAAAARRPAENKPRARKVRAAAGMLVALAGFAVLIVLIALPYLGDNGPAGTGDNGPAGTAPDRNKREKADPPSNGAAGPAPDRNKQEKADSPRQFHNALGMTLVRIEPSSFTMGSTENQYQSLTQQIRDPRSRYIDGEQRDHRVTIAQPFYLGAHEVTVRQFRKFVQEARYETDAENNNAGAYRHKTGFKLVPGITWEHQGYRQSEDDPVVCVSHNDAVAFCEWLGKRDKETRLTYRLPTEEEWEYACRAGGTGVYGSGDDPAGLDRIAWFSGNAGGATHPVGQKDANRFGLYDMLGNVWEWCSDWYDVRFNYPPKNEDSNGKVVRGGGWNSEPGHCRPAKRAWDKRDYRTDYIGFRVAADRK
jgi:formylglycine-generating enzyme required for sulfatase activity